MTEPLLSTTDKALTLNLDPSIYGTFAEIGAGQEVAQIFFRAGAASGTVAKSMSAYDMIVSDEIYGQVKRYVSKERLEMMFDHEYKLLVDRLGPIRGNNTRFFTFANTVSARNYAGTNECHGWMGIRFQPSPRSEPSDIILHVRMLDAANILQQEALGIFGVNLIYGAFLHYQDPEVLISSLAHDIGTDRIEVEAIEFRGPVFEGADLRSLNLALLEQHFTNATLFHKSGIIELPSEKLHKRPVVLLRGSFRPITHTNVDMLEAGLKQFTAETDLAGMQPLVLVEMTVKNLHSHNIEGREILLDLVDSLLSITDNVLITDYQEYYRLSHYIRRYTQLPMGILVGANNLFHLFNEEYYTHLHGGILEGFGRLFREQVKLFVYPMSMSLYQRVTDTAEEAPALPATSQVVSLQNIQVPRKHQGLFFYLWDAGLISSIEGYNRELTQVHSSDVRELIRSGDPEWKNFVPKPAIPIIEERQLFHKSG
ncbi:MAG: hypothetical protein KDD60_05690 [Bdellovibrionales bacterium]|nr:hypothetical protein [Bdellovibrionales bacterium]